MSRPRTSWRRRSGVTLIEVLAALALLGSLAVAMVLSRGRLVEQHQRAEQKMQAIDIADQLLAQWWASEPKAIPVNTSGPVEGHQDWVWETASYQQRALQPFDAHIVRLRIVDASALGEPVELTSIDVVVPLDSGGTP